MEKKNDSISRRSFITKTAGIIGAAGFASLAPSLAFADDGGEALGLSVPECRVTITDQEGVIVASSGGDGVATLSEPEGEIVVRDEMVFKQDRTGSYGADYSVDFYSNPNGDYNVRDYNDRDPVASATIYIGYDIWSGRITYREVYGNIQPKAAAIGIQNCYFACQMGNSVRYDKLLVGEMQIAKEGVGHLIYPSWAFVDKNANEQYGATIMAEVAFIPQKTHLVNVEVWI